MIDPPPSLNAMRDIFPARVTRPGRTYPKARVLADKERGTVFVFVENRRAPKRFELIEVVPVSAVLDNHSQRLTFQDSEGAKWDVVEQISGCACKKRGPLRDVPLEELQAMTLEAV